MPPSEKGRRATTAPPPSTDSVVLPRFVIQRAVEAGLDRAQLLRECGLPEWSLTGDDVRLPSEKYLRIWEVAEHHLADPEIAVHVTEGYAVGELGLYDLLYATAPTLGAGLAVCGPCMGAISTNFRFDPGPETEQEIGFHVDLIHGEGRGRDLAMQFALTAVVARARQSTQQPVAVARVTFRQSAPRTHDGLVNAFGTTAIDFGAPRDTVVLRKADLTLPLDTADSRRAALLQKIAATMPAPAPCATTWSDRLTTVLTAALDRGPVTLDTVAHELATSPRSLQRRLAESGTTWRAELDRVRRLRFETASATTSLTRSAQAELLGYRDDRSARRATRRWDR